MSLTNEQIQEAKAKLEATRIKLEAEIEDLETPKDFGDDIDGGDEEADEAEEFSANMGMAQDVHKRHEAVVTALSKIDREVYGKSGKSGDDIAWDVLSVNPESKFTKAEMDKMREENTK